MAPIWFSIAWGKPRSRRPGSGGGTRPCGCCGSASGPADPILPNALMVKALSVSGGSMANFMRTREEVLWRAGEVISAVQRGLISLAIDRVFPLADAAEAHRQMEGRRSSGKLLPETSNAK